MKYKYYFIVLLISFPSIVSALGLGKLHLRSALNDPFEARIALIDPNARELDSLTVGLADSDIFARVNIQRTRVLSKLKFALVRSTDDNPDYIRVFSLEPIHEPYLNFLLDLKWSNGRLYREYTVLLDPPVYDPKAQAVQLENAIKTQEETADRVRDESLLPSDLTEEKTLFVPSGAGGNNYGPVSANDTLWSIAQAVRPDDSISINQMMLALLRANPDAFIDQNINGLKRGHILRVPDREEMTMLSYAEALAEAKAQHVDWWGSADKNMLPVINNKAQPPVSVESAEFDETEWVGEMTVSDPELKLLAVNGAQSTEVTGQSMRTNDDAGQDLVLANETIKALTQENIDLQDRLQEADVLLTDLKRLLELKDNELALLQEQATENNVLDSGEGEVLIEDKPIVTAGELAIDEAAEENVTIDTKTSSLSDEIKQEDTQIADKGLVNRYLSLVKNIVSGYSIILIAAGGAVLVLLIVAFIKLRQKFTAKANFDAENEDFSDFDIPAPDAAQSTKHFDDVAELDQPVSDVDTNEVYEGESGSVDANIEVEEELEKDPLQQADTYLVFEQFDQAEEVISDAITNDPDNQEYHSKLLEIFYASGDRQKYEQAAQVIYDQFGESSEVWVEALSMWKELSPKRDLFEQSNEQEEDDVIEKNTGDFVDVTVDEEAEDDDGGLDFDLGVNEDSPDDESPFDDEGTLELHADTGTPDMADSEDLSDEDTSDVVTQEDVEADIDEILDIVQDTHDAEELDLEFDFEPAKKDSVDEDDPSVEFDDGAGDQIQTELDEAGTDLIDTAISFDDKEISLEMNVDDASDSADLDLDDLDLDDLDLDDQEANESALDPDVEESVSVDIDLDDKEDDGGDDTIFIPRAAGLDKQSMEDEVATKLDLAKAYVELGDKDNAKTILGEVLAEGNDEQKRQAEELLTQV